MNDIVSKIKRVIAVIEPKYQIENNIQAGMQTVIGLSVATVEELNPLAADIKR